MTNKITTVVFDLDNTLIDTEKIKEYLDNAAMEQGLNREEARIVYQCSRDQFGKVVFNLSVYLENLKKLVARKGQGFKQEVYDKAIQHMQSDSELLLPGARELLELSAEQGLRIIILSLGEPKWQKQKIEFSGLWAVIKLIEDKYRIRVEKKFTADECHLAEEADSESCLRGLDGAIEKTVAGKLAALREVLSSPFDGGETALFNDKPDETAWLLRSFPRLRAYARQAIKDARYKELDFDALFEEFAGRVECSQSLFHLKELFARELAKEYEPREPDHR